MSTSERRKRTLSTIKDVAIEANVSTTTVSRVLNKKPNISREVEKRVTDAIKKLGYRINYQAKGLVQNISNIIGVIAADITNPTISLFIDALTEKFREYGMGVLLSNSGYDQRKEFEFIDLFIARKVHGIIYTGKEITAEHVEKLNNCPLPLLVFSQEHENLNCPIIIFDDFQASYDVTRLLIKHGHRRIAFISCPLEDEHAGILRQRGYLKALKDGGVPIDPFLMEHADFTMQSGYQAAERMLNRNSSFPTVIYAATDLLAIGVMKYLKDRGLVVPDDISVFGFDNTPVSSKLVPSLSSVELDHYEMGSFSAEMLLKMTSEKRTNIKKVVFRHKIILRESCR